MKQTIEEHIETIRNMQQKVGQLAVEDVVVPAANKMVASIIQRNANEGRNTDGSKRQGYSNTPMYASQQQFVAKGSFSAQGKTGNKTKKNGQPNQSMYLPGGYEQLREIQGRRTDIKNYEYTGDLLNDFNLESQPNQNKVLIGFRSEAQSKKRLALETKFGKAFPPSQAEVQEYKDEVVEGTKELNIKLMING